MLSRAKNISVNEMNRVICETLAASKSPSIMLTGGKTAGLLYQSWSNSPDMLKSLCRCSFFFGDERCVPPQHPGSNYGLAAQYLGLKISNFLENAHRIKAEASDINAVADMYALNLPPEIDVLLLSLGLDGHIASLFPFSTALHEVNKLLVPVIGPISPYKRITITPPVISRAKVVFVLALGNEKLNLYRRALINPGDIDSIPARLVLNENWIFGGLNVLDAA